VDLRRLTSKRRNGRRGERTKREGMAGEGEGVSFSFPPN